MKTLEYERKLLGRLLFDLTPNYNGIRSHLWAGTLKKQLRVIKSLETTLGIKVNVKDYYFDKVVL